MWAAFFVIMLLISFTVFRPVCGQQSIERIFKKRTFLFRIENYLKNFSLVFDYDEDALP